MADDRDRNLVRETCAAVALLNRKLEECHRLGIHVDLSPSMSVGTMACEYRAEFTRTERILPAPAR